ncbi:molybdopterin-synthase adenylyltransferase MoeB [Prochlorococcus sp. MIT 1341]|uniref:molybdopterin-synthase adenylyltransferase MoeB n=1 Tax=Prochlorococcus sp. MIT 1341 TaxID=3096221 RepID=UPI002A75038B|nr:molybdopterin-synthase adenylyltransferase MoeB [Prochlorococcus sp. MIT 1341]
MNTKRKPHQDLSPEEIKRFSRHINLPEVGLEGQKRLKNASVLCIGIGGLGSPLLIYLSAAGVGRIGIVDFDVVEESNLQRQIIHRSNSVGGKKTSSAKDQLLEINPNCQVDVFETKITEENVLEIIKPYDLVCDGSDNFATRYLINDACVILHKPNIYGSISQFEGQASVFNLSSNSPNYRDLLPEPPPNDLIPSCAEGGVLGVLPGIIGVIQATEAIKIITGIGDPLDGRLLVFNALSMKFRELRLSKDKSRSLISKLPNEKDPQQNPNNRQKKNRYEIETISTRELKMLLDHKKDAIALLDVRNPCEAELSSIPGAKLIPLKQIESGESIKEIKKIAENRKIYIHCKKGFNSAKAIRILRSYGIESINVKGGIESWEYQIIKKRNA